jgi:hypothetical protein
MDVTAMLGATGGALATLLVQGVLKLVDQRHARETCRVADQKMVARETLRLIERLCRECAAEAEKLPRERNSHPLLSQIDDIAVRVLELTDVHARELLTELSSSYWMIAQPYASHDHPEVRSDPWVVKQEARAILGALLRGEPVPARLSKPALEQVKAANEIDEYLTQQIEASEVGDVDAS